MENQYFITNEPHELVAHARTPISWLGKWGDWNKGYGKYTFTGVFLYLCYGVYDASITAVTIDNPIDALLTYGHYLLLLYIAYYLYKDGKKDDKNVLVINSKGILHNEAVFYWHDIQSFQLSLENDADKQRPVYCLHLVTKYKADHKINISAYNKKVDDIQQALHKNKGSYEVNDAGYTQKINVGETEKPKNTDAFIPGQPAEVIAYYGKGSNSYIFFAVPLTLLAGMMCQILSYGGIPFVVLALLAWYRVVNPGVYFTINSQGITIKFFFGFYKKFFPWSDIAAYHFTSKVLYYIRGTPVVNKLVFQKKWGGRNLILRLEGMENQLDDIRRKVEWLVAQHNIPKGEYPVLFSENSSVQLSTGYVAQSSNTNHYTPNNDNFFAETLKNAVWASRSRRIIFAILLFLTFLAVPLLTFLWSFNYPDTYDGLSEKMSDEAGLALVLIPVKFILLMTLLVKSPAGRTGYWRFAKYLVLFATIILWMATDLYFEASKYGDLEEDLAIQAFKEGKVPPVYGQIVFASYMEYKYFPNPGNPKRGWSTLAAAKLSPATKSYMVIVQLNDSMYNHLQSKTLCHHFNYYTHYGDDSLNIPKKDPDLLHCLQFYYDFPDALPLKNVPPLPKEGKYIKINYDPKTHLTAMDTDPATGITPCYDSIP